jgi:Domain of unknown function (DUF4091)/Cadherin-like beta sandwich domain
MRFRTITLVVAGLLLSTLSPIARAGTPQLDVWTESALRTIYRTSTSPQHPVASIRLVSARNEYESAQIALRSKEKLRIDNVRFSDLRSRQGGVIARKHLRYRFVAYEDTSTVQPNAFFPDRVGMQLYPKSAMPDPLSNQRSVAVEANSTQPIFVTSYVPKGTEPGTYQGTATVDTTVGRRTVPIQVSVFDVTIPDASQSDFVNYHWTMTNGFTWDGFSWNGEGSQPYDVGKHYYGVETYSDKWFKLMDEFARVLTEYRTNMVWVRTDLFLQQTGTELSEFTAGVPSDLDWSLFDRYVETFQRRGITSFANQHLIHALNKMPANEKPDDSWNTKLPDELPVTDAFLRNYLTALHSHLKERGWTEENGITWYQHIRDEPIAANDRNWWTYVAREIGQINQELGAGFKTMDADPDGILLDERTEDYVDTWVPLTPAFEAKQAEYKARQAAGDELWVYTCEVNTPPWLNRFWTQPTVTGRLLFWNLQRRGVTGHLHWAWNAWYTGPWKGDSYIVYPDRERLTVKSSLRYEAHRDGLEDYELLRQLERVNPALAARIADSAVSADDPRNYTQDPAYIQSLHDYLVRAAAGTDPGEPPAPTSPYPGQDVPRTVLVDDIDDSIEAGGTLSYSFQGAGIDLIVEKNDTAGKVAVSVDGGRPEIIDLYEAVPYDYFTAFRARDLAPDRTHTLEVVNLSDRELRLDGLRLHLYDGQVIPDASLASLRVDGVPEFGFDRRIRTYQVIVPDGVGAVTLTPALSDPGGGLSVNGTPVGNGATVTANIRPGKNRVEIRTTASDGVTSRVYRLTFVQGAVNTPEANLARDYAAITASAARSGEGGVTYGPQKMVDGDYGTMFAAEQGYTDTHPFPHEIVLEWNEPRDLNTIVLATRAGMAQGLLDVDVQVPSADGAGWTTVAEDVQFRWKRDDDDGVMEYSLGDLPQLNDVRRLRVQINEANYTRWSMYAAYELELYDLPDHGLIEVS